MAIFTVASKKLNNARYITAVILAGALVAACGNGTNGLVDEVASSPDAGDGEATTIKVGYGANSPQYSELFVAQGMGLFEKYGLDVTLRLYNSSAQAPAALTSGGVDIAGGGSSAFAAGISRGLAIEWIAVSLPRWPLVMWAENSIGSLPELRGRKIGITGPGSLGEYATNAVLAEGGLTPSDVEIVSLGDLSGLIAGLREGHVDAILINPPLGEGTAEGGNHAIYDASELPNASLTYTVNTGWCESHGNVCARFLAAITDAIEMLQSGENEDQLKQIVGEATEIGDPELLEISYEYYPKLYDVSLTMEVEQFEEAFVQAGELSPVDVAEYLNTGPLGQVAELRGRS